MKPLTHLINPISVIAMFAALCEASATTVLPHLDEKNRQVYIWFLIMFPSGLVTLFFLTLNFNHHVLYAPRDRAKAASNQCEKNLDPQAQSNAENQVKSAEEPNTLNSPHPLTR